MTTPQRPTTSITRELDSPQSPLRQIIKPHQPMLDAWRRQLIGSLSGKPWIRPARASLAWMSGHAIGYRTGWWLNGVGALEHPVLAGLMQCPGHIVGRLISEFDQVCGLPSGALDATVERAVCTVAVACASVEPLYRAGPVPCALVDLGWDAFVEEYSDVIDDVVALTAGLANLVGRYDAAPVECGTITGVGYMGGDADLVAGSELVEIKCVIDPRRSATPALRQLLVHAARLHSETAALFLPRQHTLVRIELGRHAALLADLDTQICAAYGPPAA